MGGTQRVHERALVEEVTLVERDTVADVLDSIEFLGGGAAHHAVHLVALIEQELRQVRAVLTRDSGDQRASNAHLIASAEPTSPRSQSTVSAIPSRSCTWDSQPSNRRAFSTDGQRRSTSTSKLGRLA